MIHPALLPMILPKPAETTSTTCSLTPPEAKLLEYQDNEPILGVASWGVLGGNGGHYSWITLNYSKDEMLKDPLGTSMKLREDLFEQFLKMSGKK